MNTNSNIFINNQITLDNILYIADLPKECTEEDMISFFKNYNIAQVKIFQYIYSNLVNPIILILMLIFKIQNGVNN